MSSHEISPERNFAVAAVATMRMAGLIAALQQRWLETLIGTAVFASREWAHLVTAAHRSVEEIMLGTLAPTVTFTEPLMGRRKMPSRRARSVVIDFPERRAPN